MEIRLNKEYNVDENDCLWRYTDLHQLLYFLNTESIFFAPLSSFSDPLEGISDKYVMKKDDSGKVSIRRTSTKPDDPKNIHEEIVDQKLQHIQQYMYASCWFLGDNESMAMWETHSNPDSVAINFPASELTQLITRRAKKLKSEQFPTLCYGKVDYLKMMPFDEGAMRKRAHQIIGFLKDKSYKHEEEFRFIVIQKGQDQPLRGFDLPIGPLSKLPFEIITHPDMEDWKFENLSAVLKNFKMEKKLRKSDIVTRKIFP